MSEEVICAFRAKSKRNWKTENMGGGDIERKMKLKTEESLEVKEQKKMILFLLIQKPFASS